MDDWTPSGRIVQGHPLIDKAKGFGGKDLTTKDGTPRTERFFALAIPKTDPAINVFWQKVQQIAATHPGGAPGPTFAWKIVDGDTPPLNTKEGFAGCYVIRLATGLPVKCYTKDGAQQIIDPKQIKCGDYGRAYVSIKPNEDLVKPGVYINPQIFELLGYGEEIHTGIDPTEAFKNAPPASIPAGASAAPVGGPPAPPAAGPPAPPAAGPPAPPAAGPPAPPITPAPDFLTPTGPVMTAKAAGTTYEQFTAQGWTDELLRAHGYMQ